MLRTTTDLSSIDIELLALAFSFLNQEDRAPLSLVCKQWYDANQYPTLKEEEKELYLGFFINRFEMNISALTQLTQEKVESAIKNKKFKLYIGAESETKEEVHKYLMPRLDYEHINTNSGRLYFIAHCNIEGDKLSILSCEELNDHGATKQSFVFSSPIICNKRGIEVSSCLYDIDNPELKRQQAEYKNRQAMRATRTKQKAQSHVSTVTQADKFDTPKSRTLNTTAAKNTAKPAPISARGPSPSPLSQNPATTFAKPKPAPSAPTNTPINRRPMNAPNHGSGSCSIS